MSADTHHYRPDVDPVVHTPEGSVFAWPEFELSSTYEPLDSDGLSVYYVYPRDASDRVLEREWLMAPADLVVDIVDVR